MDTFVASYLEYSRSHAVDCEWAYDDLLDLIYTAPAVAWELILALIHAADDEETIEGLGAGPLETLVRWHLQLLISDIEAAAGTDQKLVLALNAQWVVPEDHVLRTRLNAAMGHGPT
jgi:hypothetical protein